MDNNIDLKNLWAKQNATPPNTADLFLKVNTLKRSNMRKIIFTNVLLAATTGFIAFICIHYHPQMITTRLGIILTILAMVIFIISSNKLIPLIKKINNLQSNSDYLKSLLALRVKQHFLQTTIMNLYFILLGLGIGLYMIEYTLKMSFTGALFAYGSTLAWILFAWFYLRPKQIKKQNKDLDEVIAKFEIVSKQFDM